MFAVIQTGGKQYIVSEKRLLKIEKLPEDSRKGSSVVFSEVLLVEDANSNVIIGTPTVKNASVEATIIRDAKADKIRVIKYKAKTRYKRVRGHRQPFTEVRIEKIAV